jgi:uncharacterized membrane protein YidH (DUF202 family)
LEYNPKPQKEKSDLMKRKNTILLILSLIIYTFGLAASLTFNIFVLWANLEGQSFWGYPEALAFDTSLTTEAHLSGLSCPVILTPGEVGTVDVKVRNPNDYPIKAWISAHISMPGELENMVRETRGVPLAPGESAILRWVVTEDNIINRRMILVRVFLRLTENHPPARTKHCGVMTTELWGLSSRSMTLIALVGGHILQAAGIWLWSQTRHQMRKKTYLTRNVMLALSIFSLVMSVGSLTHSWVFSMISLLLTLLLVFTALGYGLGTTDKPSN